MRVLIAYEESYRSYGEVLAVAVRLLRPRLEVSVVQARELSGEIGRFDPHLVVSGGPNLVDSGGRAAWVTLSEEQGEPSEVCVGEAQEGTQPRSRGVVDRAGRGRRVGGKRRGFGRLLGAPRSEGGPGAHVHPTS